MLHTIDTDVFSAVMYGRASVVARLDPLVDELASVPLNVWAQEHGYAKLHANLLGM